MRKILYIFIFLVGLVGIYILSAPILSSLAPVNPIVNSAAYAKGTTVQKLLETMKGLENRLVIYDSGYRKLSYPNGDVPKNLGVCSDVVIRAFRGIGIDLQKLVHQDMRANFSKYPKIWGLKRADKNIDHRRVPNLRVFFSRFGKKLSTSQNPSDYKPGDIVTWSLKKGGSLPHIGIVSERLSMDGETPLIFHNYGTGQVYENILFKYHITGHYRYGLNN
jgi:uncharacterized protein YijF (DUF1287 family)